MSLQAQLQCSPKKFNYSRIIPQHDFDLFLFNILLLENLISILSNHQSENTSSCIFKGGGRF